MVIPAFDPTRWTRSASLSIVLYALVAMFLLLALIKPAQASGTVSTGYFATVGNCIKIRVINANFDELIACIKADVGASVAWVNMGGECAACDVYASFSVGSCPAFGCFASYHIYYTSGCPPHASGYNTCTCDDPYVPDSTATSCVLGQYSLFVIQDPQPDVVPGASKEVIVRVENADHEPQSDVKIKLKVEVNETSGGHVHGGSGRDKGTLIGAACDPPENNCATATTGPDGYASFTFKAPAISGEHTVTANCVTPSCSNTDSGKINDKVPGLIPIPSEPSIYVLIGGEENKKHHANHFLTDSAMSQLIVLAINYHFLHPNEPLLHLNDASLEWGGMFDINGDWKSPHGKHRGGVVIDVRANNDTGSTGAISLASFDSFITLAADHGAESQVHCTSNQQDAQNRHPPACIGADGSEDTNRHFHILLLGLDQ